MDEEPRHPPQLVPKKKASPNTAADDDSDPAIGSPQDERPQLQKKPATKERSSPNRPAQVASCVSTNVWSIISWLHLYFHHHSNHIQTLTHMDWYHRYWYKHGREAVVSATRECGLSGNAVCELLGQNPLHLQDNVPRCKFDDYTV